LIFGDQDNTVPQDFGRLNQIWSDLDN